MIVTQRMLDDNLKMDKYSTKNSFLENAASFVSTANAVSELDFGVLYRLMCS